MAAMTTQLTLYEVEEHLSALGESIETVTGDQEQEFLEAFKSALSSAAEKRDQVAHYLTHLEQQQVSAAQEISRLQKFKKEREAVQRRLEAYVSYCIQSQGKDQRGRYKKLEGHTTVMFLRGCPASVEVTDVDAVPIEYEVATVTMPALMLHEIIDALDEDLRHSVTAQIQRTTSYVADKRMIKSAIEAGLNVPGAKLADDKTTLARK
jgi:hypothetical protein